jgi:hypothetical protein
MSDADIWESMKEYWTPWDEWYEAKAAKIRVDLFQLQGMLFGWRDP